MNKVKEAFSKIKLKDYEKQWLVSWLCWGVFFALLNFNMADMPAAIQGCMALIWFVWGVCNVIGTLYCIYHLIAEWMDRVPSDNWVYKVINWFTSSDR